MMTYLRVFAACLAGLALTVAPASAKVTIGEYQPMDHHTAHPYPALGSPELPSLTWSQEIHHPGATYIAVHFSRFELAPGDRVVVRSPDRSQSKVYTNQGRRDLGTKGGFFASRIHGDRAIVELITHGGGSAYGLHIDKIGRGYNDQEILEFWELGLGEEMNLPQPKGWDRSVCTADDSTEAVCHENTEPAMYQEARAVARLVIQGAFSCTGWLVGCDGHIMTNEHCINSQVAADNTEYEWMAEGATCATNCASGLACPGTVEAEAATLIAVSSPLDYALLIPDTSTGTGTDLVATYGYMQLREAGAVLNEQIYIPQHPAGWGKRFAFNSTYPDDVALGGHTYATSLTEFACSGGTNDVGYWADTRGGSSGSPVLGVGDNLVVALHHCRGSNFCTTGGGSDTRNRGVPIEAVIADLGGDLPSCALGNATEIFLDGLEAGNCSAWSTVLGGAGTCAAAP